MTLTQTAALIGVSPRTLRLAVERDKFKAEHPLADGPWTFNKNTLDSSAVAELVERARAHKRGTEIPADKQGFLNLSMT
jgi:hypothetical protein